MKTEWTGREAKPAKLAVLPTGRRGETPGEKSIVKGANKKNAIRFQVRYCGRGDYGGLPAIRAHKIAQAARASGRHIPKGVRLINNHYQLIGVLKNDNY